MAACHLIEISTGFAFMGNCNALQNYHNYRQTHITLRRETNLIGHHKYRLIKHACSRVEGSTDLPLALVMLTEIVLFSKVENTF